LLIVKAGGTFSSHWAVKVVTFVEVNIKMDLKDVRLKSVD
jgi:hypothetical protein